MNAGHTHPTRLALHHLIGRRPIKWKPACRASSGHDFLSAIHQTRHKTMAGNQVAGTPCRWAATTLHASATALPAARHLRAL